MKILSLLLLSLLITSCANRDVVSSVEGSEKEFQDTIKVKEGQEYVVVGYMDPDQPMKVKSINFVDDKAKEKFMKSLKANKGATVIKPNGQSYNVNIDKQFDQDNLLYASDAKINNIDEPVSKEPIIIKSNATEKFKTQINNQH